MMKAFIALKVYFCLSDIIGPSPIVHLFRMSDTSQVHHPSSQADHETQLLWTHVVNSKRKGNNKTQQSIVSFQPYSYQSSGN